MINPDERAVEACLLNKAGAATQSQANAAYYEPQTIADVTRQGRLAVLAEGVGGSYSGHVASQYAAQKVIHSFYTSPTPDAKIRLLDAIRQANADILARNQQHPERRPLAATLVAALIHHNKLFVAGVGDNRAYVVWDQDIERLALPARPAAEPAATPPAESTTPTETPAPTPAPLAPAGLGLNPELELETSVRRLFPGDAVILCSGGLTGYLQEPEVARAVNRHEGDEAIQRMFALSAERGHHDSGAISVLRVLAEPIGARPLAELPPPAAPDWAQWEKELPPAVKSPEKPATKTSPMTQGGSKPQFKRPPGFMPDQRQGANIKVMAVAAIIALLVLCGGGFVAARYFAPPGMLAALPFADSLGLAQTDGDGGQAEVVRLPSPTPDVTNTPLPTLVAENSSPLPTPSPTVAGTPAPASAADTVSPVATPTPSPLPLPTIELPAGCELRGRFVRDATIPDGTQLAPGEKFDKAWVVINAGECPWGPGFTLQLLNGEAMGAPNVIPLREMSQPDEEYELRLPLTAPAKPGTYRSEWQMHDLNGEPFGPELYFEIEVMPAAIASTDTSQLNVLYDFVASAGDGNWSSGDISYGVLQTAISDTLELPPEGMVAVGQAQLRGNKTSQGDALLTYPHQENGVIEGTFRIDTPLQPTDIFAAQLGFTKLSILSDDGVTFEVAFTPTGSTEEQLIFSTPVDYRDSPVSEVQPLADIAPGAIGTITLRVRGGDSLSQDWALWINARLVRP